jgi:hypothetical protein
MVNLLLAFTLGASIPEFSSVVSAMIVGLFAYGLSLTFFVIGLRHLGTARTGAYFSVAPFFGALLALLMGEEITVPLLIAGTLMALGTWLHLTESHEHEHFHEELEHNHEHIHDIHHQHPHNLSVTSETKHSHQHQHKRLFHKHPHFPDSHHRYRH